MIRKQEPIRARICFNMRLAWLRFCRAGALTVQCHCFQNAIWAARWFKGGRRAGGWRWTRQSSRQPSILAAANRIPRKSRGSRRPRFLRRRPALALPALRLLLARRRFWITSRSCEKCDLFVLIWQGKFSGTPGNFIEICPAFYFALARSAQLRHNFWLIELMRAFAIQRSEGMLGSREAKGCAECLLSNLP